jgi:transcriptional regulator with XRE-family HTH domain
MSDMLNAQRLRALRQAKGWDQLTLARTAGVDPSVVSRLERGIQEDLRASVLVSLARALQTSIDSLVVEAQSHLPAQLERELLALVSELAELPAAHQHHVAVILRAYLSALPK